MSGVSNLNSAIFINQMRTNNSRIPKCASIRARIEYRSWLRVITMLVYILDFYIVILHSYGFAWLQLPRSLGSVPMWWKRRQQLIITNG